MKWETDSKIDNDRFEIERSIKGLGTFESIGTVRGNGTTESKDRYQFIDAKLNAFVNEIVYYRLKQIDVQGTFEYSPIVAVNFEGEGFGHSRSWDLSYNLVDGTPLELVVADPALSSRSKHEVRLVTADGRILLTQSTGLNEINTVLNRVLNQSPKGIYFLILQGQYESERFKILK